MTKPTNHDRHDLRKPRPPAGGKAALKRDFRSNPKGRTTAPASTVTSSAGVPFGKQRIAKVIARAGLCSRRDAEAWIEQGRISVNGITLTSPALNVDETDHILVDGAPLAAREPTRLFLFHKPRGYVTTAKDPQSRPTVFEILPNDLPRLVSIGRLDINTQGLLLLTNDGGLAQVLELPRTGWLRRYRVRANGQTDQTVLDQLASGVTIDGMNYGPIEARLDRVQGANVWLTIGLREGKNREVKRVLESLGLIVNRLIRVSFGPFQLLDLAEGGVAEVNARVLKEQLGEAIIIAAKVDFRSPKVPRQRAHPPRVRQPTRGVEAGATAADAPRRERPEKGKRKHISVLRAERRASALVPRRIHRDATADRKGREIAVERLIAVSSKQRIAKPGSQPERPNRNPGRGAPVDRIDSHGSSRPESAEPADGRRSAARPASLKRRSKNRRQTGSDPMFGSPSHSPIKDKARHRTAGAQQQDKHRDHAVRHPTKKPRPQTGKEASPAARKPEAPARSNRSRKRLRPPNRRDRLPP